MKNIVLIVISFIISFILQAVPLPDIFNPFRPYIILMTVMFWSYLPNIHFHIYSAFIIGLLADILLSFTLGFHAFIFTLATFTIKKLYLFLLNCNLFVHTFCILPLFFLQGIFTLWVHGMGMTDSNPKEFWYIQSLFSALIWPLFFSFMNYLSTDKIVVNGKNNNES